MGRVDGLGQLQGNPSEVDQGADNEDRQLFHSCLASARAKSRQEGTVGVPFHGFND